MSKWDGRVALVLGGGGARGAYQAGVLSVLLPKLEERGERPTVYVGTSAGAINAVYLAAKAHESADVATKGLLQLWSEITIDEVIRPLLVALTTLPLRTALARLFAREEAPGVFDTEPLRRTIDDAIDDWSALHRNCDADLVDAVAVVATSMKDGGAVVFCDSHHPLPDDHPAAGTRYRWTSIGIDHVMASAAIPLLFPPVRTGDGEGGVWCMDGGTRMNTPIKPAIALGADRLAIVACDAATRTPPLPLHGWHGDTPPGFEVALLHLLHGALVDPLIEDLRRLKKINKVAASSGASGWRECGYLFVAPAVPGEFATLAHLATEDLGAADSPSELQYWLISRFLESGASYELLSYLLFQEDFIKTSIELGKTDAQKALDAATEGWLI